MTEWVSENLSRPFADALRHASTAVLRCPLVRGVKTAGAGWGEANVLSSKYRENMNERLIARINVYLRQGYGQGKDENGDVYLSIMRARMKMCQRRGSMWI